MNLISVVIPFFGKKFSHLQLLINEFENSQCIHEIIIIEDNFSELVSLTELKKISQKVKIISNKKNCGPSYSRNTGANYASGNYILFCDSDVFVNLATIELVNEYINENKPIALQGIYSLESKMKGDCSLYKHYWQMINILNIPKGETSIVGTSLFLIQKDIFDMSGGFEILEHSRASVEDRIFGQQLRKMGYSNFLLPEFFGVHHHEFNLISLIKTQLNRAIDEIYYASKLKENVNYTSSKKIITLILFCLSITSVLFNLKLGIGLILMSCLLDVFFIVILSKKFRMTWPLIAFMNNLAIAIGVGVGMIRLLTKKNFR